LAGPEEVDEAQAPSTSAEATANRRGRSIGFLR